MPLPDTKIGGYSESDLKKAYWWVSHRLLIYKIIKIALVVLCVFLWGWTLWGLTKYFLLDWNKQADVEANLGANYIDYKYWAEKNKPKDFVYSSIKIFDIGGGRYDFFVMVKNPNDRFAITSLKYKFNFNNRKDENIKETFILPGQTKYLVDLGVSTEGSPSTVALEVLDIKWQRLPSLQDYQAYEKKALDFVVSDEVFSTSRDLGFSDRPISKTLFKVKNNSPYNYWNVGFYVLLYNGSEVRAVNYIVSDNFDSGVTKDFDLTWYENMGTPDRIEVQPDINILDNSVFRPLEAGSGEAK